MDHLICASLSHTHYSWYEVAMLKISAEIYIIYMEILFRE